eukprot:CAMPEP_0182950858 /NCGR_PEP_ID=MMETSP0105_2-20130417/60976_1 /TAXON_ID=81532 ORGANISM="Acanthoeca-like sp., Strain 10tr" /NCGR_SAMPLE_ID=MMETSP0105_2 /ASSEMBLY_ACC=CAM_ASM_000205 /LENGTH=806 /DNA_ID=CAMNT_0025091165 /DNA_START=30 /DNA_END=2450 /DNA_ORIENTATION=-
MDIVLDRGMLGTVLVGGAVLALLRNVINGPKTAADAGPSDAVVAVRGGVGFKALIAFLTTLDDLVWVASFKWIGFVLHNPNRMKSLPKPGEEGVRCMDPSAPLTTDCEGSSTVFEIFRASVERYSAKPAFGTRTYIGDTEPEGPKKLTKKIFGETTWRTFAEVGDRATAFGAALRASKMAPFVGTAKEYEAADLGNHCMMIYENTCDDWTTAFLGAMSQSIVVATSYATLGFDAMLESAEETGASLLLCNRGDVLDVVNKGSKTITTVVYSNNYVSPANAAEEMPAEVNGIKIFSVDEFIALGTATPADYAPPKPETLAVIMFTSGSTGKPKGVMLTHECVTAAAGGAVNSLLGSGKFQRGTEVYLAYLPAAHILELTVEVVMFSIGGCLGYADPRTISSKGAVRQLPDGAINDQPKYPNPPGAIQEFRPTVMAGVPKVWDVLKAGATAKIATMKPLVQAVLGEMVAVRDSALRSGTDSPIFGFAFGKAFGKMIGGRLKAVISGGGPLSSSTQTFVRAAMCPTFVQGYGLTETNGATCVQDMFDVRDGIAGAPLSSVEVKLHSVPDVVDTVGKPYLATDTTHAVANAAGSKVSQCLGRGELWVRGGTVSKGYFRLPEKTKSEFLDDGWFRTGDICIFTPDGSVKIVDRLKNLVKLRGGEYVAVENMEKEYAQSVYVNGINGGVMVVADGEMDRAVIVAQANMIEIERLANELKVEGSPVELCRNSTIEKAVLKDMVDTAMPSLSPLEKIVGVRLLPGTDPNDFPLSETAPWTVDNGGLLASNKLGRKSIQKELAAIVAEVRQKGIR